MQRIKIFLSHSVHKEADKQIMDQLIQLLEEAGYDVYCDRERLKVGDRWRNELYSAIYSCHAAVVLVTQEALDTKNYPWAFKECSMFTMVRYLNNQFPIIPVTMTGVKIEDIEKSPFKELQFNEIMAGSHEDLISVIKIIRSKVSKPISTDDPFFHHINRIVKCSLSPCDRSSLSKAIEELDQHCDQLNIEIDILRYNLARILLSLSADKFIAALPMSLFDILQCMGLARSKLLVEYLAPFWLDPTGIASMEEAIKMDYEMITGNLNAPSHNENYITKAFGLNYRDQLTALLYIHYAGFIRLRPYFEPIRLLNNRIDMKCDVVANYEKQILEGIRAILNNEEVSMPLNKTDLSRVVRNPIFIIFPYDTEVEVIQALREKFKPFIFIFLTGKEDTSKWNLPNLMMLNPCLEEEIEGEIVNYYHEAIDDITIYVPEFSQNHESPS